MKKSLIVLSLTGVLASALSYANITTKGKTLEKNEPIIEEIIVVTAIRTPQNSAEIMSSFAVMTREDIEQLPVSSVAELLNTVNGLQMSQNGGTGQTTSVFTRGTNAGHTLVVVDGQRISSATLGQVAFSNLSLDQIERVEVIKGPRTSLWGSDAIGGVIQIFTRQLNPGEASVDLGYGTQNIKQASISTAFAHGKGGTTITLAARAADGFDVFEPEEIDDDGYRRENISLIGYQNINAQWTVNWLAKYDQGNGEYDNSYGADENAFEAHQWQLSAQHNQENWYQEFRLGTQKNKSITFGKGISEQDGSFFETLRLQASWLGSYQLSPTVSSTSGIDLTKEKVDTVNAYNQDKRGLYAVFTHLNYDNNTQIIEGSIRYDDIEDVKSKLTYNASIGQRFSADTLLSLNMGSGFKAPSFNDLYYPTDEYSIGNPDLIPESSTSTEVLMKTSLVNIDTELSIYQTKIDDLIEWDLDQDYRYTPTNIAQAKIKGIELTFASEFFNVNHELQLGYVEAVNTTTNEPLIRRSKNSARYQLSRQWQQLKMLASINYQGEREDSQWPGTVTLKSYTLVNVSASYQINSAWTAGININNLLDKKYYSASNYVGQPAQYMLTVSYRQ
jgi:vitamin B12 transporter